tara:strand:+ start:73 stop:375 length:303 start_codon:yes stop_codon:yes gene_type:complete
LSESEPGIDGVTVEQLRDFCHQRWVADLDLEKFFDRVSHDVLMGRLARWIKDQRILKLIRANLRAGIREASPALAVKGSRRGNRSRRCYQISCSMNLIAN